MGLLFERKEEILVTSDRWTIAVDINLHYFQTPVIQAIAHLHEVKESARKFYVGLKSDQNITSQHLEHTIGSVTAEAAELLELINEVATTSSRTRPPRGLINGLGYGLHYIAGVATDDQVAEISRRLDILGGHEQSLTQHLRDQVTYLN
jgi:hypothetical protein